MEKADRRVGSVISGKWRVESLLGSGSMAAVYAATHRNGARAALKILHPALCVDPNVCERFLGEGYLANSIQHRGVVRVLDDGVTDDGCVYLVMDLLEGDTLEGRRQRRGGKLPLGEILGLGDQLMDALVAVHAAGIIHRDLKPQNVFVTNQKEVKLLDFGVARVFDRQSASKLSVFGLVLGTPSFMPPEQALGSRDKVDERSDIWALGATLFTCLSGETVHTGPNVQAKLLAAATVKPRSLRAVAPELPPSIISIIDRSLEFKKEDRWESVAAMRAALTDARTALRDVPVTFPSAAPPVTPSEPYLAEAHGPSPSSSAPPPGDMGPDGTLIGMPSDLFEAEHVLSPQSKTAVHMMPGAKPAGGRPDLGKTLALGSAPPRVPSTPAAHAGPGTARTGTLPPPRASLSGEQPIAHFPAAARVPSITPDTVGGAAQSYMPEGEGRRPSGGRSLLPLVGAFVALAAVAVIGFAIRQAVSQPALQPVVQPFDESPLTTPSTQPSLPALDTAATASPKSPHPPAPPAPDPRPARPSGRPNVAPPPQPAPEPPPPAPPQPAPAKSADPFGTME